MPSKKQQRDSSQSYRKRSRLAAQPKFEPSAKELEIIDEKHNRVFAEVRRERALEVNQKKAKKKDINISMLQGQRLLRNKITSIWDKDQTQSITQIVKRLQSEDLPIGSPKKPKALEQLVQMTLAAHKSASTIRLKNVNAQGTARQRAERRTLSNAEHASRTKRYAEIKSQVASSH